MKILVANHSSYPRIDEGKEWQQLRSDCEAWQRGEKTAEQWEATRDRFVQKALRDQEEAGCDLVTDGQIRWHDAISHLAGSLEGVKITGLLRYFDSNTYFRQPRLGATIARRRPLLAGEIQFALGQTQKPLKAVLTGPLTLAALSLRDAGSYATAEDCAAAFAEILAEETAELRRLGIAALQFDEPIAVYQPQTAKALLALYRPIIQAAQSLPLALSVFFGDAAAVWEELIDSGFSWLGVDLTYSPTLLARLASEGCPLNLSLGLVDARNTRLEDAASLAAALAEILPKLRGKALYLTPSCGLEYLPRAKARAKLALLAEVKRRLA